MRRGEAGLADRGTGQGMEEELLLDLGSLGARLHVEKRSQARTMLTPRMDVWGCQWMLGALLLSGQTAGAASSPLPILTGRHLPPRTR